MSAPRETPPLPYITEVDIQRDTASISATTTFHAFRVPTGRKVRIAEAWFTADAAFAANGSNYFVLALMAGVVVLGTITLATDSLVAATPFAFTLDTSVLCDAGSDVTLVCTETGTAVLPPGRLQMAARNV